MLYNDIKILHIINAALLLTCMAYSFILWLGINQSADDGRISQRIQTITWAGILPLLIFQLFLGFTLISLKKYDLSSLWIKSSIISFVVAICSWLGFIYCSLIKNTRTVQSIFLSSCAIALLSMIFFMANKI